MAKVLQQGVLDNRNMISALTDNIISRSHGLLVAKPEVTDSEGKGFLMMNDGSVEIEVAEFLYGLVRLLKPSYVLDTGTHYGVSAAYMGQAMVDNGLEGQLTSLEHNVFYHQQAQDLWNNLGLFSQITGLLGQSLEHEPKQPYDLMLLDTEPDLRFKELVKFYPYLKEGGFVFIHDLHRHMSQVEAPPQPFGWPFGALPKEVRDWVKQDKLRPMHFPTGRGFMGFYKPHPEDYKWK
jgi:predicted O-methyltransferase YrrM